MVEPNKNTLKSNNHTYHTQSDDSIRFQSIFDTVIDGIIIIDERGSVELINPAAAKLFGYDKEEVLGQNIKMLMPSPHRENHDTYLENYRKTGKAKIIGVGREVEGRRKDGSLFPILLAISEVNLENRRVFTGVIHDISQIKKAKDEVEMLNQKLESKVRKRTEELIGAVNKLLATNDQLKNEIAERSKAEEALRQREKELQDALEREKELNTLKSRFVSIASHEFRTPLSTILSSVELIEAYSEDHQIEKRKKHTKRIKSAVTLLTGILNDFLSLSRLEEGKIAPQPVEFELEGFCKEVMSDLKVLLKKGQKIEKEEVNTDQKVFLERKFLKNILFNLLSNAIKYSPEDTTIHLTLHIEDEKLKITVSDEGIGIPEEDQQYLFTRFFRAHNVENIQGTGLGLSIVKRYLEAMNGAITFESKLDKGTTFFAELPIKQ